jgi:PPM family protein phosphatase
VLRTAVTNPETRGMATTADVVLAVNDYAIVGHVGDSRTYLIRGNRIHQLTEDHTVAAEMRKTGNWTADDPTKKRFETILTRAIGMQEYIPVDLFHMELAPNDKLLLCTDGLTSYLQPPELLELSKKAMLERLPAELIRIAKERGGHDNITAVLVGVESATPQTEALDALKKGEVLGRVSLFRYLAYPELIKVLGLVKLKGFQPGQVLIQEGSMGDELFVIASGGVNIQRSGQLLASRGPGQFLGEIGFFNNIPRTASVQASVDTATLAFTRRDLLSLLRKEPAIAVKFLWAMSQELSYRDGGTPPTLPDFELPFSPDL